MKIDLHVHTNASDGEYSPRQVVNLFEKKKFNAIAICDHDMITGVREAMKASENKKIKVIPGIEISTRLKADDVDLHLVGLGINFKNKLIKEKLKIYHKKRIARMRKVIKKLQKIGFEIEYKDIKRLSKGILSRTYLATALLKKKSNREKIEREMGKIKTNSAIISFYTSLGTPAYVRRPKISFESACRLIKKIGGIPIIAHPGASAKESSKIGNISFMRKLKKLGAEGIEIYSKDHSKKDIKLYRKIAKRLKLLVSGGSDFHGTVHGQKAGSFHVESKEIQPLLDMLLK